jgi:DNA mismatch repair protein MutS
MVRQYLRIKAEHPGEILLFRIGDFYETFGEDAHAASEILGIALTKKHIGNGKTLPLAGIPYHALDAYLGKLIRAGRRVAICEQVEDARDSKGPTVEREVVRVVTPGTVIEERLLDDKSHNYIAAVARQGGVWGLARCDLSTGALAATEPTGPDPRAALFDEISRVAPAELIATAEDMAPIEKEIAGRPGAPALQRIDPGLTRLAAARSALLEQFGVQNLEGFGAEETPAALCAAGALVAYLRETQRRAPGHVHRLEIYRSADHLILDAVTRRSLELTRNLIDGSTRATLLDVLDCTRTPMGGRLLRDWLLQPLQDLGAIHERQDAIASLVETAALRERLGEGLRGVRDIERILGRVHCRTANARDLIALARSLRETPSIKSALVHHGRGALARLGRAIETLADLADRLEGAVVADPPIGLREGGIIRDGFSEELDRLRSIAKGGKSWIAQMRAGEIARTGINSLKIGFNKVFGYYIEVSKANVDKVPADYERRQTLTNGERYVTPALKEKEAEILGAEEKICALEADLFERLRSGVEDRTEALQRLAAHLAEADALASLARAALDGGYVRPEVDGSDLIEIRGGRHPVVEALLADRPFVPNDVALDSRDEQIWLITGPNMAGKSTFIRQVALIALMAHVGSFVPARSARIGLIDRIFTRVGATDHLARGQSTFLVEMTETANILNNATPKSLVVLDEIGRGTSTYDGLSIAWAVLEHLHENKERRARALFATHYHELAELEGRLARLKNYNVAVAERGESITFLYEIRRGGSDHSYGIHAARLAGMPAEAVARAREILFELECARSVGEIEPSAERVALPELRAEIVPAAGTRQLDFFDAADHPIVAALRKLEVARITPLQAMQILDELSRAAREK